MQNVCLMVSEVVPIRSSWKPLHGWGGLAGCLAAPADELKQAAFANEQKLNLLCKYLSLMDQMS